MANSPALHAVVFRIGEIICAAPAGIVREILPRLPATRIPGVPDAVEGLVNVRGWISSADRPTRALSWSSK